MSTGYNNNYSGRFALLAQAGERVFHARDLANLWQIKDNNTLYTTLKRYVQRGLLFRVYKGLYSLVPADKIDPQILGLKALHEYAYISTETVLIEAGIIQQNIDWITLVSAKSKKFSVGENNYWSRQLADKFLFNSVGIIERNGILVASLERAVADLLYFNPNAYFDGSNLIDWQKVKKIQRELGYKLTPRYYDSSKSERRGA
jgi:predicted transcriptional regulator of viral defense system